MPTNATDVVLAGYRALTDDERDEVFERFCQLRVADAAEGDSDMARFLRSLAIVAEEVGRIPTVTDYKEAQPRLAAAGQPVESFTHVYAFFGGSWARVREALTLTESTTPRRIEARFRSRQLGKVWRYTDDTLREVLLRAAEHWGRPPSVAEFEWWREHELRLAQATGDGQLQLPSASPYRKRWGGWEPALLALGFSAEAVARRLEGKTEPHNKGLDLYLPEGLAVAEMLPDGHEPGELPLTPDQVRRLRSAYEELPLRTRHVLTVRLGLGGIEKLSLKAASEPLGLSLDRVRQLQLLGLDALTAAVTGGERSATETVELRGAVVETLARLAR